MQSESTVLSEISLTQQLKYHMVSVRLNWDRTRPDAIRVPAEALFSAAVPLANTGCHKRHGAQHLPDTQTLKTPKHSHWMPQGLPTGTGDLQRALTTEVTKMVLPNVPGLPSFTPY